MPSLTKLRVVIDTNVFISGLEWGGQPTKVINLWLEDKFLLLISPYLAHEIISVYERFANPEAEVKQLQYYLESKALHVLPAKTVAVCRDSKDNQILDLCLAGRANYLVTGDKDLLALKEFHLTKICLPKQFLSIYYQVP